MGLGKSTAQQARDTLEGEGLIRIDEHDIRLADPFLARWLEGQI